MKKYFTLLSLLLLCGALKAQIFSPKKVAEDAATNKANSNIESGVNGAADKIESGIKGLFKKKAKKDAPAQAPAPAPATETPVPVTSAPRQDQPGFKAYNNYDFVPGSTIIFEDDFRSDQDGEFPAHWGLEGGQGVVNKMNDDMIFAITKYYSKYTPNIKKSMYLPAAYTIEFDTWLDAAYDSNEGAYIEFRKGKDRLASIGTNHSAFHADLANGKLSGDLPSALGGDGYHNKWHHVAIAVKDAQIKVYCDQYRVLVVPNDGFKATNIALGGDASENTAMLVKNFRIAEGGGMNMLGKKFTDAKIVTHGINFDYNKATIKPESMGTLNMIVQVMKENPEVKFEVGGHTDSDGQDSYNLTLSQQRADAVKTQLVSMGIDASRLTTKGYGETKPISDNVSIEGKANNRRVEFVKM